METLSNPKTLERDPALAQNRPVISQVDESTSVPIDPAERNAATVKGNMRPPPAPPVNPDVPLTPAAQHAAVISGYVDENGEPRERTLAECIDEAPPALRAWFRRVDYVINKWHGNEHPPL